jgi:ABC-2 type transport system ATP-binding protein
MIEAQGVGKSFFLTKAKQGRFASLRTLFSRERREVKAVDDMSFTIQEGQFVGYIGRIRPTDSTLVGLAGKGLV